MCILLIYKISRNSTSFCSQICSIWMNVDDIKSTDWNTLLCNAASSGLCPSLTREQKKLKLLRHFHDGSKLSHADLASSARRGAGFPWGGEWGSLTAHSLLQSATLLSQHYHYLRWSNLHVRCSVTFYILRMRDWTVAVAQYSKFACVKVQYISKHGCITTSTCLHI
jgi:hypothetical protein